MSLKGWLLSGRFRRAGLLAFFVARDSFFASYSKFSGQALAIILEMRGNGAERELMFVEVSILEARRRRDADQKFGEQRSRRYLRADAHDA